MTGTLFAMGGAVNLQGEALKSFYQYCGGADGRIVILPTASMLEDGGTEYISAFERFGLKTPARLLPIRRREEADYPEYLQALREATGIFLTGGNQLRLGTILGGTQLHQAMINAYHQGAVIAGTSAGTAALSSLMIACGTSGALPRGRIAHFAAGLGFTSNIIFDQHFRQRNRLGRLIYAVANNPCLIGVGVDENTAAILQGDALSVAGACTVTIVDGSGISDSNITEIEGIQPFAISGVSLHVLDAGSVFDLRTLTACIPQKSAIIE